MNDAATKYIKLIGFFFKFDSSRSNDYEKNNHTKNFFLIFNFLFVLLIQKISAHFINFLISRLDKNIERYFLMN